MATLPQTDFLAERQSGIGGSDIGAVLNLDYGCARRVAYQKLSTSPDYPRRETNDMERGIHGEALAAAKYARDSGRKLRRLAVRRHPDHPEFLVHADRQIVNDPRGPGVLEVKCPNYFTFRKVKYEGLPQSYILQLQWAMYVTGYHWGSFAVFHLDSWRLLWFDMARDEELIEFARLNALGFWGRTQEGELPIRLAADDKRCARCEYRRTCQAGAVLDKQLTRAERTVTPIRAEDAHLDELCARYVEMRDLHSEAEALKDEAFDRIKAAVGKERRAIDTGAFRIYVGEVAGAHVEYDRKSYTSVKVYEV